MIAPETLESLKEKAIQILSRDGKVNYDDLNPIAKATWGSYIKGFMECAEYLLTPNIETEKVCASCQSVGITDIDCICVYQKNYPTVEREIDYCKVCGSPDDL